MEAGFIVTILIVGIVGVVVGFVIGKRTSERRYAQDTQYTQGTINIDCSDPEFEPGIFLGLAVPVRDVVSRKYVMFDVNVMNQDSHK